MKKYFLNPQKLPLVVEPDDTARDLEDLKDLAAAQKNFFRAALCEHGALLLRGFNVRGEREFADFVSVFSGREFFNYAGGASPRFALDKNVYNSTEYPPDLALELHNELSYSKIYPRELYFFCATAPARGGETTLGDSRRILKKIRPQITELFRRKNILYERNLQAAKGAGYSWQEAFATDDKAEIERVCRAMEADFEWRANDCLQLRQTCAATAVHPATGEEVWFNQAHGFHTSALDEATRAAFRAAGQKPRLNSSFADGTPICVLMLEHVREVLRRETIPHKWQPGDILIVDNLLAAHGRMPFSGARKIVLAMT